jgi:hypothetical protein
VLEVKIAKADMGELIGREGKTAQAIIFFKNKAFGLPFWFRAALSSLLL